MAARPDDSPILDAGAGAAPLSLSCPLDEDATGRLQWSSAAGTCCSCSPICGRRCKDASSSC